MDERSTASVSPNRLAFVAILLTFAAALVAGCDSHGCSGTFCACYQGYACIQSCGPGPCQLDCASFETSCQSTCGEDCVTGCHDGPSCRTSCGARCQVSCDHVSSCTASCGAGCDYQCISVSSCAPRVGDGSDVLCQSVGSCAVRCDGACRVRCVDTGSCSVACPDSAPQTHCPDGLACGSC